MRRTHLRGHTNILKRRLIHIGGFNLGLLMRAVFGVGTPRALQGQLAALVAVLVALWDALRDRWRPHDAPSADHATTFTPHRRLELLPVEASERGL
jgi:transposase